MGDQFVFECWESWAFPIEASMAERKKKAMTEILDVRFAIQTSPKRNELGL
jgi:hypothetical protein